MAKKIKKGLTPKMKRMADKFMKQNEQLMTDLATKVQHSVGDLHVVNGIQCKVAFVNHGDAWLVPVKDYEGLVARHIAYAMLDDTGKVKKL